MLFPAAYLSDKAEVILASRVVADVFGPHAGELLAHCAEGVLHCSSSYGVIVGCESTVAVSLAEDLQDGDGVAEISDEGIDVEGVAK